MLSFDHTGTKFTRIAGVALVLAGACGFACSSSSGTGTLTVKITAEDGVVSGFPTTIDGESVGPEDGWKVSFDKYLVAIGNITLRGADGESGAAADENFVANVKSGELSLRAFRDIGARRWEDLSFQIAPPNAEAFLVGGVEQADADRMSKDGISYLMTGSAQDTNHKVTFELALPIKARYSRCTNGEDGTEGVVVRANSETTATITLHAEHLFFSSLASEEPTLLFEPIAAARNASSHVTLDTLSVQRLADLNAFDGSELKDAAGNLVIYDAGGEPLSEPTLREFIVASVLKQAHLNGEGLCTIEKL